MFLRGWVQSVSSQLDIGALDCDVERLIREGELCDPLSPKVIASVKRRLVGLLPSKSSDDIDSHIRW